MQIDTQRFLRLVESANTLGFIDIEASGLRGDYNTMLCASIKQFQTEPTTHSVSKVGKDRATLIKTKASLEGLDCWVTYYGRGFDIKMLNTRLLIHKIDPIEKRPHIDMYYQLKAKTIMSRRSQGHYCSWLQLDEQKMSVSADDWAQAAAEWKRIKPTMVARCESDVNGLQGLYERTKHLITDITL